MFGGLDYFSVMQGAVTDMLLNFRPVFEQWSLNVFWAVVTINLAFLTFQFMTNRSGHDWSFVVGWTLLKISMGRFFVVYYSTPDPLLGVSFSHLITVQMKRFASILDASGTQQVVTALDRISLSFIPPGWGEWWNTLLYFVLFMVISAAKVAAFAIIALGLLGQAILVLLGPIFVCLFLVPGLDQLFWGWLRALLQYSFLPVMAYAYLFIGAHIFTNVLGHLPPGITTDMLPTLGTQVGIIITTWLWCFKYIPSINAAIFHGGGAHHVR
jgi:type IV secretory pathway VirB6-like protein